MNIRDKIQLLLDNVSQGIYEKDEVIRLALLSSIAGESIFLLGPPGVAKSLIARKLKFAFKDGKSFEYLMSRFSTPDEIFGPVSIKKLKDEDKYERLTEKYLPGANIVFLDEIWKSGPSIQNALLTILNEKIYRNGEQEIAVNIRGIISASNEVPSQGDGVDALWDRFLVRYYIDGIKNNQNFIKMITATDNIYKDTVPREAKISDEEYIAWREAIDQIALPSEVVNTIQLIKIKVEEYNQKKSNNTENLAIYDRRWKKIIRLLRSSAYLNGRNQVDLMDCFLIAHCLWHQPKQFDDVMEIVSETIRKHGYSIALNLNTIKQEIKEFEAEVDKEIRIQNVIYTEELMSIDRDYYEVLNLKQYFDGYLIKKSDFGKLSREENHSISLYDQNYALTNRVNARLSSQENTIEIFYNSKMTGYPLKTKKVEKVEIISKKPHPILYKYWEDRVNTLEKYIEEQVKRVEQESPEELNTLKNNLFVHPQLSEIVEANMHDVRKSLNTLKLQVEQIAFNYRDL